jgi:hypothetical protein
MLVRNQRIRLRDLKITYFTFKPLKPCLIYFLYNTDWSIKSLIIYVIGQVINMIFTAKKLSLVETAVPSCRNLWQTRPILFIQKGSPRGEHMIKCECKISSIVDEHLNGLGMKYNKICIHITGVPLTPLVYRYSLFLCYETNESYLSACINIVPHLTLFITPHKMNAEKWLKWPTLSKL